MTGDLYHIETSRLVQWFKSMDWFLYDNGLRHERVNNLFISFLNLFISLIELKNILLKEHRREFEINKITYSKS